MHEKNYGSLRLIMAIKKDGSGFQLGSELQSQLLPHKSNSLSGLWFQAWNLLGVPFAAWDHFAKKPVTRKTPSIFVSVTAYLEFS